MDNKKMHGEILAWVAKEFDGILKHSKQAIYVYVCDHHKLCNPKFAAMLGYKNPKEWAAIDVMLKDIIDRDQERVIAAYQHAMEDCAGSAFSVTWKHRNGTLVKTNIILVPFAYKGELFAFHFITEIK